MPTRLSPVLFALLWLLASSIVALAVLHRQRRLSRPASIAWVGLDIALVGMILTPGIAWGDFTDESALGPISALVFYAGIGVLIAAAVSWRRAHSRGRSS